VFEVILTIIFAWGRGCMLGFGTYGSNKNFRWTCAKLGSADKKSSL